jgi:hypothetical protein
VVSRGPIPQKTGVVPPAEVREDLPLPSDPKVLFLGLFVLAVLAGGPCRSEIVDGFTRVTRSTGNAGIDAYSKLTSRPDR